MRNHNELHDQFHYGFFIMTDRTAFLFIVTIDLAFTDTRSLTQVFRTKQQL